jgi:hypothetical protein
MSVMLARRSAGTDLVFFAARRATARVRVGAVVVLGSSLLALELSLRGNGDIRTQVAGQLAAFALFVPAALLCWRGLAIGRAGPALVLVFAVALHAAAFEPGVSPPLSTDLHRYAWDARVQASGINPYRHAPVHSALAELRDTDVYERVNLKSWQTVYPPGAQASFIAARGLFGSGLRATTWLFLLAEAAAIGLLLLVLARTGAPPERVVLLAWHPLAISEIAANGHVDALAVLGISAALVLWQGRRHALAGGAIAFAALVKLGPVLLVPALVRRGGRAFVAVCAGVVLLAYGAYASAGTAVFGDLERYVDRQHFGGSLYWLLSPHLGDAGARVVLGAGLAALLGAVALREHETVEQVARTGLLVLGGLLLALGYVQPWHALWLLPFLVLTAAPGWLWLTGTLPLLYLFGLDRELPEWVRPVIYLPLGLWAAARLLAPRRRKPAQLAPLAARPRVAAVVPVLDEAEALPAVLVAFPPGVVDEVVVVDGGSRDGTVAAARAADARVVVEGRRGYGRACAAGAAATDADVIVFLDGDGSDDPASLPVVLRPVLTGEAALSLGARSAAEAGALLPHQRAGNRLVTVLLRLVYGLRLRDVPPMRAIRRDVLEQLGLREMTYGWPTEMIVKAARAGMPVVEVDVPSRARRAGQSKIAGRLGPSARAGARMLAVVARYA